MGIRGDREDSETVEPEVRHHLRPHREPGNQRIPPEEMLDVRLVARGVSRYRVSLSGKRVERGAVLDLRPYRSLKAGGPCQMSQVVTQEA
jgi:hypothetical protein